MEKPSPQISATVNSSKDCMQSSSGGSTRKAMDVNVQKKYDVKQSNQGHTTNGRQSETSSAETGDNNCHSKNSQSDGGKRVLSDNEQRFKESRSKNSTSSNGHKGKKININVKPKKNAFNSNKYNPYVLSGSNFEGSEDPTYTHGAERNGLETNSFETGVHCAIYNSRVDLPLSYQRQNANGLFVATSTALRWTTQQQGFTTYGNSKFNNKANSKLNIGTSYTEKRADNISSRNHTAFKQSCETYRPKSEGKRELQPKENYHRSNTSANNTKKNYYEMMNVKGHNTNTSGFQGRVYENSGGRTSFRYGNNVQKGIGRVNASNSYKNNYYTGAKNYGNSNGNPLGIYWPKLKSEEHKTTVIVKSSNENLNLTTLVEPKDDLIGRSTCDSQIEKEDDTNVSLSHTPPHPNDSIQQPAHILNRSKPVVNPLSSNKGDNDSCISHQKDLSSVLCESEINPTSIKGTVSGISEATKNLNVAQNSLVKQISHNQTDIKNNTTDNTNNVTMDQSEIISPQSTSDVSDKIDNNADLKNNPSTSKDLTKKNQRKNRRPQFNQKSEFRRKLELKTYIIELNLEDSFDKQAIHMISKFEITKRERIKVDQLVTDLAKIFTPLIDNVKSVLFGSVVAGTAFRYSDVDIFLECDDNLPQRNVKNFILHHGSIINKGGLFKHGVKIANARVPILKAVHVSTGLSVDVSFKTDMSKSHYGLCNSILVKHLCSHDSRVRNLIMLVLFWAKCHGFIGKYQISSFTFILMVIFYLQIVEILPPLHLIIQVKEGETHWPTSFNNDINLLVNSNTESLESLYLGFFSFYSAVRFNEVVISVFAGELVLGVLFDTTELLPQCYSRYRHLVAEELEPPLKRSKMCIQEPFNLSWNTVRGASASVVEMLKQYSLNVCNVFAKLSPQRALAVIHSQFQTTEGDEDSYSWELPCPNDVSPNEWFKKVIKACRIIFSSILLMEVKDSQEFNVSKFCKFYFSDAREENPIQLIVYCNYLVASKERNRFVKAFNSLKLSEFEKQIKASHLYAEVLKKGNKNSFFRAAVYIVKNEKNGSTEISVNKCAAKRKRKNNEHRKFVSFLKNENFTHFLSLALDLDLVNEPKVDTATPSTLKKNSS